MRQSDSSPVDIPRLTGYLLGASFIAWFWAGWVTPMIVVPIGVAVLRRALKDLK